MSQTFRLYPQRLPAVLCGCVLLASIVGLATAFVIDMARARHDFDRVAISEGQLATVARIEAALNGGDQASLATLLGDYRRSVRAETAQLDFAGERRAQAAEVARADRLFALASQPDGVARNQAIRRLVAVISDGERVEATEIAARMERLRRRTTILAFSLTGLALVSALLGAIGLVAANRRLTGDVAARTQELATIERSRRLFFAKVSHELRTPVTVMRGEAEVALSAPGERIAPLREALDRVVANAEFLDHRIEELLSLARAENGELTLEEETIDLGRIVTGAGDAVSAYARSVDVGLAIDLPDAPLAVRGDARWLQQALVAMLDNGVKFSSVGSTVSLVVTCDEQTISIAISDEGIGIPAGDLPRIFDAYYQSETGRERGGTGLGLALARWIVERHGGSIHAANASGGGCVMTIRLPRIGGPRRMNILLVEDDAGIGRFIHRGLSQQGYAVTLERDGRRTEDLVRTGDFSALILDRTLPDCDGADLCRRLRDAALDLPILMLTARGTLQDRLDGFASGADDYLPKPFAFEELLARLSAVIRRRPNAPSTQIVWESLTLEPQGRTALVDGEALPLSPREFDLLLELVRARGGVVPRERLLTAIWGSDADVTDNALDVYVGYLRRRLAGCDRISIETHRGRGFSLRT